MSIEHIDLFPFPAPRHGQRDLLRDARECTSSGDVLVAHAPTGLGKTAVALTASLEASLRDGGRTVFLTPRQSQHQAVIGTVKMLPRNVRTVDLLSRETMCPLSRPVCLEGRRCHLQAERRMAQCAREILQRPLHAQELIALCLRRGACPYLTARIALNGADLVVGDVSRAFGDLPDVIRFQGTSRPQRLVVDEAHNLPGRVMDMFSKELVLPREGDPLEGVWERMLSKGHRVIPRMELRQLIEEMDLPSEEELEGTHDFLRDWNRFGDASVRVAFPDERRISLRFLEPGLVVNSVLEHCASAILMSGTLYPPEVFATRLGLKDAVCRSYPSPFDPARRLAVVVPDVGTRYRERCSQRTADMASRISELSSAVPGNVMVFLPSYAYLSAIYRELRRTGQRKSLLAERPGTTKAERDGLAQRLLGGGEVLMLCNIHGSFSEGVDFPAGCLSAVMVAGLPIPPPSLERAEMMARASRGLGDEKARTFLDTYEALSKVLQACGRAIRREEDRAAVVLMDPRYKDGRVMRLMPPDLVLSDGDPVTLLNDFFRQEELGTWETLTEGERIITGH